MKHFLRIIIIAAILLPIGLQAGAQTVYSVWHFVKYKSDAKKKIYFVQYKSDADLIIYFSQWKSDAGWRNNSKKHLMQ